MRNDALKWDDLRVFLALARHGRPTVAARALRLDPATVARRLTALEAALGAVLVQPPVDGGGLTEAGRKLLGQAEAMERLASDLTVETAPAERLVGTVRIGAPDGVSHYLLADACDALTRTHPELQVQILALPRMFSVSKREADLVVTVAPPTAGRLTVRKIADYCLGLYARADVLESLGPVRTMADLSGVRGIGYISDMIFDKALDYYALLGREQEPALTSNSLLIQLRWCLRGAGICILPEFVAREHPELQLVLPEDVRLTRAFYLVRHQDDARVARVNHIADVICDWVGAALDPAQELGLTGGGLGNRLRPGGYEDG